MFTKESIVQAQAKVKSGADYPRLVKELKAMGVRSYEHSVADGAVTYFGQGEYKVTIQPAQDPIRVEDAPSVEAFRRSLSIHQQGKTDYPTFCRQAGQAGVAKWTSDLEAMTVTYSDRSGKAILVEAIPGVPSR
jgi:uncharacterized protein YbcV (DUF1398 family)